MKFDGLVLLTMLVIFTLGVVFVAIVWVMNSVCGLPMWVSSILGVVADVLTLKFIAEFNGNDEI